MADSKPSLSWKISKPIQAAQNIAKLPTVRATKDRSLIDYRLHESTRISYNWQLRAVSWLTVKIEDQPGLTSRLLTPLQAGKNKSISWESLQGFLADREAYENAIATQSRFIEVSQRSYFAATYLKSSTRAKVVGTEFLQLAQSTDKLIKKIFGGSLELQRHFLWKCLMLMSMRLLSSTPANQIRASVSQFYPLHISWFARNRVATLSRALRRPPSNISFPSCSPHGWGLELRLWSSYSE